MSVVRELVTKLSFAVDNSNFDKFEKKLNQVADRLSSVGKSLSLRVTAPLAAIAGFSLKASAGTEKVRIQFEGILGSAEAGAKAIEDMNAFVARSPFLFDDVEKAARRLLTTGTQYDDIEDQLRILGDVAAGAGTDLNTISQSLIRVRQEGKVSSMTLRQLALQGVPAIQELARILNVSQEEVEKLASEGLITEDVLMKAFKNMGAEGGVFADQMDKQSRTLGGATRRIMGVLAASAGDVGDVIANTINLGENLDRVVFFLERITKRFNEFVENNPRLTQAVVIFSGLLAVLGPTLIALAGIAKVAAVIVKGFAILTTTLKALGASLLFVVKIFSLKAIAIAGVVAGIVYLGKLFYDWINGSENLLSRFLGSWEEFKEKFIAFVSMAIEGVKNAFWAFFEFVTSLPSRIFEIYKTIFTNIFEFVSDIISKILGSLKPVTDAISSVTGAASSVGGAVSGAASRVAGGVGSAVSSVGSFFGFGGSPNDVDAESTLSRSAQRSAGSATSINVNSSIEVEVPDGTPEEQQRVLENAARNAVRDEYERSLRHLMNVNPLLEG